MLFWSSHISLEISRTWIRAFLNCSGFDHRGYRPQFISCIVLKITFRSFSFIVWKNCLYCSSNIHSATCFAEYEFGDNVMWYIFHVHKNVFKLFIVHKTSSDRGSKMNQTILKSKLYLFCISTMFVIVLSADLIPKTYQFVVEIQSVNRNISSNFLICFIVWFLILFCLRRPRSTAGQKDSYLACQFQQATFGIPYKCIEYEAHSHRLVRCRMDNYL